MTRRILISAVALIWPTLVSAALGLSFDGQLVRATDVQPGARVAYFAIGLVPNGYDSEVVRWRAIVTDDDHDRTVVFDAGRAIPCRSIWVVADLQNGETATAAQPGCSLLTSSLPARPLKRNRGLIDGFSSRSPHVEVLYVDAPKGAWVLSGGDGDANDLDGRPDGVTTSSLSNATPMSPEMGPAKEFKTGNVLIVIDFYRLDVAAIRVTGSMLNEVP